MNLGTVISIDQTIQEDKSRRLGKLHRNGIPQYIYKHAFKVESHSVLSDMFKWKYEMLQTAPSKAPDKYLNIQLPNLRIYEHYDHSY